MFISSHWWNIMCSVSSQELFKWPMVRGRIMYYINFVLDLHLVLKVCLLSNLSTSLWTSSTCILFCLTVCIWRIYMGFMQSVEVVMIISFTLKSQTAHFLWILVAHSFVILKNIEVFWCWRSSQLQDIFWGFTYPYVTIIEAVMLRQWVWSSVQSST